MDGLLRRDALLARLTRSDPRIVALVAPAGFGKTTLALAYVKERGGGMLVDLDQVSGELDLARRLIEALSGSSHGPAPFAAVERALGDAGSSVADRLALTLEAWRSASAGCVVFERAEYALNIAPVREFFGRLLSTRGAERTVVICSRDPLRPQLPRHILPHELVTLRAGELAFAREEIGALFAGVVEDGALLDRVAERTRGWPLAVFALRRLAGDGRLGAMLDRFDDDAALREMREYLAAEVVARFDAELSRTLFTAAALGHARPEDLRASFPERDAASMLAADERASGFLTIAHDGAISVHPLLSALLLQRRASERERVVRSIAAEHERDGDPLRAAELYLLLADRYASARALSGYEILGESAPPARYRHVLEQLDAASIVRFPRLWGVRALGRIFCVDSSAMLDEAETIWRTLPPGATPTERYYVFVFRMLLMSYTGRFDEALASIERFGLENGTADPPQTLLDGHLLYLRGLLRARRGNFDLGERDLNAALPIVDRMDVAASGVYLALGADIARVRGEWSVEREFLARSHERSDAALPNFAAFNIAEVLIGAWFAGDRQHFNQAAVALDEVVAAHDVAGFAYLTHIARGRSATVQPADLPKFVIFAELIALSRSRDESERANLARDALARAQRLHMPFVEALAALAVALCDPARFDGAVASARAAAARCDAPALVHAVNAFSSGHENVGMLSSFVAQITQDRSEAAPIALEILAGRVRVDGAPVRLSGREFELLAAIAQRREPTTRARLASTLWPDLDEFAARNALSVCLHRLRAHLRRADAIERDADGYRLHADAFVDVWELDRATIALRVRDRLRETDRATLIRALECLREERGSAVERWEWFEPALRRLNDLRTACAHRLAADALERGDPDTALNFAAAAIEADPCDEPARELAVRAHLALGDRAAALRQYRQYRDVLRDEFGAEPSTALTALVMTA